MPQTNLCAYTEATPTDGYPGYLSLNRQDNGEVTLTVRSSGHAGTQMGTIVLTRAAARELANAITYKMLIAGTPGC